MERKEGYYWVTLSTGEYTIALWHEENNWFTWMDKKIGIVCSTFSAETSISAINEARIPAPDEILETEDNISGMMRTVFQLVMSGIDFQYNAKSQNLIYAAPAQVRIISDSIGFNFSDTDKPS